ncbi:MAG: hypothetical protein KatS3mg059_0775 [Thermomicrobiales bacterium]|nr:MAG: hypothetical protein KatS3mg059_0775 [Thermomicrobiales bacterium]
MVARDDERRGKGRAGYLVNGSSERPRWSRRWNMLLSHWGAVFPLLLVALTGCATGAPSVASNATGTVIPAASLPTRTPTAVAPAQPAVVASATSTPTVTPVVEPTATPRPTRTPTPTPTPRPAPPPDDGSGLSQVYDRGTSGRPEVALTFDAGADRGHAEEILDILKQYGVKASFGVTGHWAEENPDLVKRMVAEGHMVFNHTWSHRSFTGASTAGWDVGVLTREERQQELKDTERLIRKLTKGYVTAPYFRPPYGDLDDSVLADLADAGYYITVMWTCDTLGWNGATVDEILDRCAANAEAGDIILLHVGSDTLDAAALPQMIEMIQEKGLELVTVEELLQP